jgi:hypothetical protein
MMARPSSKTSSGLQTELSTVSTTGEPARSEVDGEVRCGMVNDVWPTGAVSSVNPLYQAMETKLGLCNWFVTETTVADRTRNPVTAIMYIMRSGERSARGLGLSLVITDDAHRSALRSTRNRTRTVLHPKVRSTLSSGTEGDG